ncbi:hypothetical protein D3C72_977300 [compost metagenome]
MPRVVVCFIGSVTMVDPIGPSSTAQPSFSIQSAVIRNIGWVKRPTKGMLRPSVRTTSACPAISLMPVVSIRTPRAANSICWSASGSNMPLVKKVVSPQSGSINAW